ASDARFSVLLGAELARRAADVADVAAVTEPLAEACLFTDVRDGFDLARLAKKHKIRQRMRRLREQYDDARVVVHTADTIEPGLDRLVTLHDARWAELGHPLQGLLARPGHRAFLLDAVRALDAEGMVNLLTLEAGGRPAAVELDFRLGRRVFLFKGTFHPDFAAFSPSQLLTNRVFEDGLADGIEVFDFCRGDVLYKRRWTNGERHLSTVTLTQTGLAGSLARRRLRLARAAERRVQVRRASAGPSQTS
ncbi:MAG: GNAT family N-acetyltransferase, partial [Acidimicrobiales bacterium]